MTQDRLHNDEGACSSATIASMASAELFRKTNVQRENWPQNHEVQTTMTPGLVRTSLFGGPFAGSGKYLGGVFSPKDGFIYAIPGSAQRVLRIDPRTDTVKEVGPSFKGKLKWLRGVVGADNCIYAIPANASRVLRIRPPNNMLVEPVVELLGPEFSGDWKWHGGQLLRDGCIYCVPCCADTVLRIDTNSCESQSNSDAAHCVTLLQNDHTVDPGAHDQKQDGTSSVEEDEMRVAMYQGRQKWYGGLLGSDGCMYCVPNCHSHVLKVTPSSCSTHDQFQREKQSCAYMSLIPITRHAPTAYTCNSENDYTGSMSATSPQSLYKWHGGVVVGDAIFCVPSHAKRVLKIDVIAQAAYEIGACIENGQWRPEGKFKFLGGEKCERDGRVYFFPCDADRVLCVDPCTNTVEFVGDLASGLSPSSSMSTSSWPQGPHNKWQNGYCSTRDGCVYAIPQNHSAIVKIAPGGEVSTVGEFGNLFDKWEGGVDVDGVLYCMPLNAKQILKIEPSLG